MKFKSLIASVAFSVLGTAIAGAADMPMKAAPPPYLPPPFTWTGFYVGGNIGGAWTNNTWTDQFFGTSFNNNNNNGRFIGGGQVGVNYQVGQFVIGGEWDFDWAGNNTGGWLVGAGFEYAFTNNWTVKAEYDYLGLGSRTFIVPAGSPFLVGDTFTTNNRNVQMFKVGFNYLFNWGAPGRY